VHAGKLGQVTNFTIVGGTASISTWFCLATVHYGRHCYAGLATC